MTKGRKIDKYEDAINNRNSLNPIASYSQERNNTDVNSSIDVKTVKTNEGVVNKHRFQWHNPSD